MSRQQIANRCRHQQCGVRASCHVHHDFPPRGCGRDSFVGNFRGSQVEPAGIEIRHELAGFDRPCGLAEHRAVVSAMLACEQRIQGEYSGDRCIGPAVSRLACLDLLQVCRPIFLMRRVPAEQRPASVKSAPFPLWPRRPACLARSAWHRKARCLRARSGLQLFRLGKTARPLVIT